MSARYPYETGRLPRVAEVIFRSPFLSMLRKHGPTRGRNYFYGWLRRVSPHAPLVYVEGVPFPKVLVEEAVRRGDIRKTVTSGKKAANPGMGYGHDPKVEAARLVREGGPTRALRIAETEAKKHPHAAMRRLYAAMAKHIRATYAGAHEKNPVAVEAWHGAGTPVFVDPTRPVGRNPLPRGNIYWRDIRPGTKVSLVGKRGSRAYVAAGKTVYWSGQEAREAQLALNEMMRRGNPTQRPAGNRCGTCSHHISLHRFPTSSGQPGQCGSRGCSCMHYVQVGARYKNPYKGRVSTTAVRVRRFGQVYHVVVRVLDGPGYPYEVRVVGPDGRATKHMIGQPPASRLAVDSKRAIQEAARAGVSFHDERGSNPLNVREAATIDRVLPTALAAGFSPPYFKGFGAALSTLEGKRARTYESITLNTKDEASYRHEGGRARSNPFGYQKANPGCKRCRGVGEVKLGPRMVACPTCCRKAKNPLTLDETKESVNLAAGYRRSAKHRQTERSAAFRFGQASGAANLARHFAPAEATDAKGVLREIDSQSYEDGIYGKKKRNPLASHKPGCQCIFHSGAIYKKGKKN